MHLGQKEPIGTTNKSLPQKDVKFSFEKRKLTNSLFSNIFSCTRSFSALPIFPAFSQGVCFLDCSSTVVDLFVTVVSFYQLSKASLSSLLWHSITKLKIFPLSLHFIPLASHVYLWSITSNHTTQ